MNKIVVTFFVAYSLLCGLKPIPPLGCSYDDAVCMCDSNGNCEWRFNCK